MLSTKLKINEHRDIRWQDRTLGTTFRDILILQRLRVREIVVFVEQEPLVDGVVLPVPRHNKSNTTPCNISEPNMESTEFIA